METQTPDVEQSVIDILKEQTESLGIEANLEFPTKLKDTGLDSIQFLNVVIAVCEKLNIDVAHVNSMQISSENSISEFIDNFKPYIQN